MLVRSPMKYIQAFQMQWMTYRHSPMTQSYVFRAHDYFYIVFLYYYFRAVAILRNVSCINCSLEFLTNFHALFSNLGENFKAYSPLY